MNSVAAISEAINSEGLEGASDVARQLAEDARAAFAVSDSVLGLSELKWGEDSWGNKEIPIGISKRAAAGMGSIGERSSTTFDILSVSKIKGAMSDFDLVYEVETRDLETTERPGWYQPIGGRAATLRTTFVVHIANSGAIGEGIYAKDGQNFSLKVWGNEGGSTIFEGDINSLNYGNALLRLHHGMKAKFVWDLAFREDLRKEFI